MKEIKCTVVTTTGTYKTQIYTFDGITTEDKIQQLNCSGIYNITGIIEEPETAETETEVQETETAEPETLDQLADEGGFYERYYNRLLTESDEKRGRE